jgi:hypothetical protein
MQRRPRPLRSEDTSRYHRHKATHRVSLPPLAGAMEGRPSRDERSRLDHRKMIRDINLGCRSGLGQLPFNESREPVDQAPVDSVYRPLSYSTGFPLVK